MIADHAGGFEHSLLFSGVIFVTSILGASVITCAHHSILFTLSRCISICLGGTAEDEDLPEAGSVVNVHVDSSTWIGCGRSPWMVELN